MRRIAIPVLLSVLALSGCSGATPPSPSASSSSAAPLVSVTVQVQGTGTATEVAVTVGQTSTSQPNVQLPFSRTIRVPKGTPVQVQAQNGTDTGQIEASVTKAGTTLTDTAVGEFAAVSAGSSTSKAKSTKGAGTGDELGVSPSPLPSTGEVVR